MLEPWSYDPPAAIEGPNNGLVEALADRLYSAEGKFKGAGAHRAGFSEQGNQVKEHWRLKARAGLEFLIDIGFVGPGGPPADPERFDLLTYAWLYEVNQWEILDSKNGFVALVNESADVELLLAAPVMMTAINALLGAIPPGHPAREMPELQALEMSLPEHRESREKQDADV